MYLFENDCIKGLETYDLLDFLVEYLLIISPDSKTAQSLAAIKTIFARKYGCHLAVGLKSHITLVTFLIFPGNEKTLINFLTNFSKSVQPFEVLVNNFGEFEHVVFAEITSKAPIIRVVKDLKMRAKRLFITKYSKFIVTPHLTIARGMTAEQHDHAWAEWQNKKFTSSFDANEMILLKRHRQNKKCEVVGTFTFQGQNLLGTQLNLAI